MIVLASEDIGNADPQALLIAVAAAHAVEHVGFPEAEFALTQAAIYLSLAPKSDAVKRAIGEVRGHIREHGAKSPPAPLRSAAYPAARKLGPRQGLRLPARPPGPRQRPGASARGPRGPALLLPGRGRAGRARAVGGDPQGTRPGVSRESPADGWPLTAAALVARPRHGAGALPAPRGDRDPRRARAARRRAGRHGRPAAYRGRARGAAAVGRRAARPRRRRAARAARQAPRADPGAAGGAALRAPVGAASGSIAVRGGRASPWADPVLETGAALLAGNAVCSRRRSASGSAAAFERGGVPPELIAVVPPDEDLSALADRIVDTRPPETKGTMVVLDGAPLERTVTGALWAAFAGGGRHRAAVGRLVVVPSWPSRCSTRVVAGAERLRPGDPRQRRDRGRPAALARDARRGSRSSSPRPSREGATLLCGGPLDVPGVAGAFYAPAVLRGVPPDARILREPVPGPVLAVVEAGDEDDAIALATARPCRVGLGRRPRARRAGRAHARAEVAWVNEHGHSIPSAAVRLAGHVDVTPARLPAHAAALRPLAPLRPALVRAADRDRAVAARPRERAPRRAAHRRAAARAHRGAAGEGSARPLGRATTGAWRRRSGSRVTPRAAAASRQQRQHHALARTPPRRAARPSAPGPTRARSRGGSRPAAARR